MSAWITECHLRAPAVRVARQLFGLLRLEMADLHLYAAGRLQFADLNGPITFAGAPIIRDDGTLDWMYLICPDDEPGWCRVYPDPSLGHRDIFDRLAAGLGCAGLFGYSNGTTGAWRWAEYRAGRVVDACSYFAPDCWFGPDGSRQLPGEPPPDRWLGAAFADRGREFSDQKLIYVLWDVLRQPPAMGIGYKLIVART